MNIKTLRQVCRSHRVTPPLPEDESKAKASADALLAIVITMGSLRRKHP